MAYGTLNADVIANSNGLTGNAIGPGFKNRIINGAIGISQRAAVNTNVAVGTSTSGTFGPDRFSGYTGTASLWNILQVTTGAYDFPYALRLQRIASQTSTSAVYLRQIIETNNCIDLAGQKVTLSFYATAGANYSGGAATVQILTGTAADQGTASLNTAAWTGLATPVSTTFTPTTTRTRFSFTGTLGSTIKEVAFSIDWSGSGTAGANDYIDITAVQLELGETATSFDTRPFGTELQLCRRYCWVWNYDAVSNAYSGWVGMSYSTSAVIVMANYPVEMRGTPTLTISAASDFTITTGNANGTGSTLTFQQANNQSARIAIDLTTAPFSGSNVPVVLLTANANARLNFLSEL